MSDSRFPQRVLRAPKAFKHKSSSDFPDYAKPKIENGVNAACSNPRVRVLNRPRTWMTDLEGRTFGQSISIIQAHRMTYKIVKVDDTIMADSSHTHNNELFLTLRTDQAFNLQSPELPDKLRVSDWVMRNKESTVVVICEK